LDGEVENAGLAVFMDMEEKEPVFLWMGPSVLQIAASLSICHVI
jgi:hypothetical protein